MSSLLQFSGEVSSKGVGLQFYRPFKEMTPCATCNKLHERIYVAFRKPVGTWGQWVVFRYNGKEHVPDLSCPIDIDKLPVGAKPLSNEDNSKYWHS